jgi:Pyridine nucleotide-disulphide oxidoreductase
LALEELQSGDLPFHGAVAPGQGEPRFDRRKVLPQALGEAGERLNPAVGCRGHPRVKVADLVHHAAAFGTVTAPWPVAMARVRQRKREMVDGLIAMHLERYQSSGAELIMGTGYFVAPKTLEVELNDGGTHVLAGERVFLNVGTHATIPDLPGLIAAKPLTHIEVLELDRLPAHLIVFGGGYVSLEFAQAYRRFGSRVTVIEHGPQLAGREDPDVADAILQVFRTEGIDVWLSAPSGCRVGLVSMSACSCVRRTASRPLQGATS